MQKISNSLCDLSSSIPASTFNPRQLLLHLSWIRFVFSRVHLNGNVSYVVLFYVWLLLISLFFISFMSFACICGTFLSIVRQYSIVKHICKKTSLTIDEYSRLFPVFWGFFTIRNKTAMNIQDTSLLTCFHFFQVNIQE